MSIDLWQKLPERFLRMKFAAWAKLDHDVKRLIVELANDQKFKCALCSRNDGLEVEHDHDPQEGSGDRYTIYNIRGLVCRRCNWHLMVYEKEEIGDYLNWENASCNVSSQEYEDYVYTYECRVGPLLETQLEKRMGSNYWRRRLILQRFDEWRYEGGHPPGWWLSYKKNESRKITTPEQALHVLVRLMEYVEDEFNKDANYQPPEQFLKLMILIRPIFEQAKASKEGIGQTIPSHSGANPT